VGDRIPILSTREATPSEWARFNGFRELLVHYVTRRTGDIDAAEDIVSDVLAHLYVDCKYDGVVPVGVSYAFKACENATRSYWRHDRRYRSRITQSIAGRCDTPEEVFDARFTTLMWVCTVLDLPKRAREAYLIVEVAGSSTDAAAVAMGISKKAVEMRLAHARRTLRGVVASEVIAPKPAWKLPIG
jgi:RNA polymerase sigma factor (sigma-70 family)